MDIPARYFGLGLIGFADDEGYGSADIFSLSAKITGDRNHPDAASWYASLEGTGFIKTYEVTEDGHTKRYYHVVKFLKHQKIDRPTPSEIRLRIGDLFTVTKETSPPQVETTSPTLAQRIWREDCEAVIAAWSGRFGAEKALSGKAPEAQAGLVIKAAHHSSVSPLYLLSKIPTDANTPWPYFIKMCGVKVRAKKTSITEVIDLPDGMRRSHHWNNWLDRHRTQCADVAAITKALAERLSMPKIGGQVK